MKKILASIVVLLVLATCVDARPFQRLRTGIAAIANAFVPPILRVSPPVQRTQTTSRTTTTQTTRTAYSGSPRTVTVARPVIIVPQALPQGVPLPR